VSEGGTEGGREGEREDGREGGKEAGKEGGREGETESLFALTKHVGSRHVRRLLFNRTARALVRPSDRTCNEQV